MNIKSKKSWRILNTLIMALLACTLLFSTPALAACETTASATPPLIKQVVDQIKDIKQWIDDQIGFVTEKFKTALFEVTGRQQEFDGNVRTALTTFSDNLTLSKEKIAEQLAVSQVSQTLTIGTMTDAAAQVEILRKQQEVKSAALQRYAPSELACQAESVGPGASKAYQLSKAINRILIADSTARLSNAKGTVWGDGPASVQAATFAEYRDKFCDPEMGDQGCGIAGPLAGQHRNMGSLLWGEKQTIDMRSPDNQLAVDAAIRYLLTPTPDEPIYPTTVDSAQGHEAILDRRSKTARLSAVQNSLGQMLAERTGGSGVNTQSLRIAGGILPEEASTNASYREIQEAMTRDRFYNPGYIINLVTNPAQVTREQVTMKSIRLQSMHDMYRRLEEMLVMEAAGYSHDLDGQMPGNARDSEPLR